MYSNIKSCFSLKNTKSDFFYSNCGVRQGENLSPVLFSLFLNDLEEYLKDINSTGVQLSDPNIDPTLYIEILLLIYADDTILISDDPQKLQNTLNNFASYCKDWKLNINTEKTKVMALGSKTKNLHFKIMNKELEIVKSYKYLGTHFSSNGNFKASRLYLADQAKKAMHLLYKRISNLNLPPDLAFKLFDHTVLPILLYSVEIWGYESVNYLEQIHCNFIKKKKKIQLRKSTPNYMIYAESGRYPLEITVKCRMIGYWNSLLINSKSKISYRIYQYMLNIPNFNSNWINYIKDILNSCGMTDIWLNQNNITCKNIKKLVKQSLLDQYLQKWHVSTQESNKGKSYYHLKQNLEMPKYLTKLKTIDYLNSLKFRTGNHHLPVETGRWNNIEYSQRKCTLCNLNDIGDEMHMLLICPHFEQTRKSFIKKYYFKHPSMYKFIELMRNESLKILINISKFIKVIMQENKRMHSN